MIEGVRPYALYRVWKEKSRSLCGGCECKTKERSGRAPATAKALNGSGNIIHIPVAHTRGARKTRPPITVVEKRFTIGYRGVITFHNANRLAADTLLNVTQFYDWQ